MKTKVEVTFFRYNPYLLGFLTMVILTNWDSIHEQTLIFGFRIIEEIWKYEIRCIQ
jgi:hypothetical protein